MSFGMKVEIRFSFESTILRNVTEIHFHPRPFSDIIAFESDIHQTGIIYSIDKILEYEVTLEEQKAKAFDAEFPLFE